MNRIEKLLQEVVGEYCWGVDFDVQLNLQLNFGQPHLRVVEPPRKRPNTRIVRPSGRWWLWVWMARWTLRTPGAEAVTFSSPYRRITAACAHLSGQRLTQISVRSRDGYTVLAFDLGGRLDVRRFTPRGEEELWHLYRPGGYVLTVRNDGAFSHERGNRPDRWRRADAELAVAPEPAQPGLHR